MAKNGQNWLKLAKSVRLVFGVEQYNFYNTLAKAYGYSIPHLVAFGALLGVKSLKNAYENPKSELCA